MSCKFLKVNPHTVWPGCVFKMPEFFCGRHVNYRRQTVKDRLSHVSSSSVQSVTLFAGPDPAARNTVIHRGINLAVKSERFGVVCVCDIYRTRSSPAVEIRLPLASVTSKIMVTTNRPCICLDINVAK